MRWLRVVMRVLALVVLGVVVAFLVIIVVAVVFGGGIGDHS